MAPLETLSNHLKEHLAVAASVAATMLPKVEQLAEALRHCFENDGRLYTFGNGGSAADALHFAEELIGRYRRERRPLPAMSLAADPTGLTCIGNDYGFENLFARQLTALARRGDVAVGFTTSGNSENVLRGLQTARAQGAITVLMSGETGGRCAAHADHVLLVPSVTGARIQEMHVLIVHLICERMDDWLLGT